MKRPGLYQVLPTDDYKVYLYYENGEVRLYDCSWILEQRGVWDPICDIEIFKDICTIMNGTLSFDISRQWDPCSCLDICPDVLYKDSLQSLCPLS